MGKTKKALTPEKVEERKQLFIVRYNKIINKSLRAMGEGHVNSFQLLPEDVKKVEQLRVESSQLGFDPIEFELEILASQNLEIDFFDNFEEAKAEAEAEAAEADRAWRLHWGGQMSQEERELAKAEAEAKRDAEAFAEAQKNIFCATPRETWEYGSDGITAIIAVLHHFPETKEVGNKLDSDYFGIMHYEWDGTQSYDVNIETDDDDDAEDLENKNKAFKKGYIEFCFLAAQYADDLATVGFSFPANIIKEGEAERQRRRAEAEAFKAEAEAKAKAEAEAKAKAKAEAEAKWVANLAEPRFQVALANATPDQKLVLENWGHKRVIPEWDYTRKNGLLNWVQDRIDDYRRWCKKNYQDFDLNLV